MDGVAEQRWWKQTPLNTNSWEGLVHLFFSYTSLAQTSIPHCWVYIAPPRAKLICMGRTNHEIAIPIMSSNHGFGWSMIGAWLRQEHANLSSSANNFFFRLPCRSAFFCRVACAPFGQAGASSCTSQKQRNIAILTTMCKLFRLISHGGGGNGSITLD